MLICGLGETQAFRYKALHEFVTATRRAGNELKGWHASQVICGHGEEMTAHGLSSHQLIEHFLAHNHSLGSQTLENGSN